MCGRLRFKLHLCSKIEKLVNLSFRIRTIPWNFVVGRTSREAARRASGATDRAGWRYLPRPSAIFFHYLRVLPFLHKADGFSVSGGAMFRQYQLPVIKASAALQEPLHALIYYH